MTTTFFVALLTVLGGIPSAHSEEITFLGNSLTNHGPSPSIGWVGNWGMAASAKELDYKYQVVERLTRLKARSYASNVTSANQIERTLLEPGVDFLALVQNVQRDQDVIVVQVGDNIQVDAEKRTRFSSGYASLIGTLVARLKKDGVLVCIGRWWSDPEMDRVIKSECQRVGGSFVELTTIAHQPGAQARSERPISNVGVASHPGDRSMEQIAERVVAAIINASPKAIDVMK